VKKKKVNWYFLKHEYKLMVEYLEDMAVKGLILEKVNKKKAIFVNTKPRKLKFCVDISLFKKTRIDESNEVFERYKESCKEIGWTYITSYDEMHFFYTEEYEFVKPIKTDIQLDENLIIEKVWKKEIYKNTYFVFITLFILFYINRNIYSFGYRFFVDSKVVFTAIFVFIFLPVQFVYSIIAILNNYKWYTKAKQHIKNGIEIKQKPLEKILFRNSLMNLWDDFVLLSIIIFYSTIIFSKGRYHTGTWGIYLWIIIALIIIGGTLYDIYGVNISKKLRTVLLCAILTIITILLYIMSSISLSNYNKNGNNIQIVPEQYSVIKISDFADTETKYGKKFDPLLPFSDYENYENDFFKNRSPSVPISYEYDEYYNNDSQSIYYAVNLEYYKCYNDTIADMVYKGMINEYENRKYFKLDVKSILAENWNADKASIVSEGIQTLILQKNKEVIKIHISEDLGSVYDEEFKNLVLEKFTKDK